MRIFIILFCLSSLSLKGLAQTKEEKEIFILVEGDSLQRMDYHKYTQNNRNEIQAIFSGLFLFYKTVFSSQDSQKCSFHPSCSVYAVTTIKKNGPIIGLPDTFDRLLRCNGLSPELYDGFDLENNLILDPVK